MEGASSAGRTHRHTTPPPHSEHPSLTADTRLARRASLKEERKGGATVMWHDVA